MPQFYLTWVDENETTFDESMALDYESVYSFVVTHAEGDFPVLDVVIRNPHCGLLCSGRKQWAWFSWNNGASIEPLFFGRLVGIPNGNLIQELIPLQFIARPSNFNALKAALAETLKVSPYWSEIFIDDAHRNDPNAVLEAYSLLWHIDRTTHAVTVSDILIGEDGTEQFDEDTVFAESVSVTLQSQPVRAVTLEATVGWTQPALGTMPFWNNYLFNSFTGDGMISDFPKPGASLKGGWRVNEATIAASPDISLIADDAWNTFRSYAIGNLNEVLGEIPEIPDNWIDLSLTHTIIGLTPWEERVLIPNWNLRASLNFSYEAERKRIEKVTFTLKSDVQAVVTMPSEEEAVRISISGADVGEPLDPDDLDTIPIGDARRRTFFSTDRGLEEIEYLVSLARSRLLFGSRVVQVEFEVPFARAAALSCRMNGMVYEPRLPAGSALGKVTLYTFGLDGDTGEAKGKVTIGCAIGKGTAVEASAGDADYCDDDYCDADYQFHTDEIRLVAGSNVGYTVPVDAPNDDGLNLLAPLTADAIISNFLITNPASVQAASLFADSEGRYAFYDNPFGSIDAAVVKDQVKAILTNIPTVVSFNMQPVQGGPFTSVYEITVTDLVIPEMIDLEECS